MSDPLAAAIACLCFATVVTNIVTFMLLLDTVKKYRLVKR